MKQENASVIEHREFEGGYNLLGLEAAAIAPDIRPGQFVHLRVPHLDDSVLRRPFSVFNTRGGALSILYKAIGKGTSCMKDLRVGETVNLIGPLGRPFPTESAPELPVLVAGGYGMAALYLVAARLASRGVAFFGGARATDILCVKDFEDLGWPVVVATEDGSRGRKGRVTDALDPWLRRLKKNPAPVFFACGPNGLLQAVARRAQEHDWKAWVSVDRNMGCGVGACLTCVVKVRNEAGGWAWARSCREGPVFECRQIVWEDLKLET